MGKQKYQKKINELFQKSPVVSFSSIQRIVQQHKKTDYTKQLVRNMISQGKIKKIGKGHYSVHDNPQLAIFALQPAYFGLQDALSMHNLWEQETIPIILTTGKVRPGIRKIVGTNVLIRRIAKKYWFGIEYLPSGDIYYPYSDIEKTLIDLLYFKEKISKETMTHLKRRINLKKLHSYLDKYPQEFRKRASLIMGSMKKRKKGRFIYKTP